MSRSSAFVLVHPAQTQAYPLLGFFPWPLTVASQVVVVVVVVALLVLLAVGVAAAQNEMLKPGLQAAASLHSSRPPLRKAPLRRAQPSSVGPITPATLLAAQQQSASCSTATVLDDPQYRGLRNTGNTCFFNSTLQSISALPTFERYLRVLVQQAEVSDTPTPVIDALLELVHQLSTPVERSGSSSINPTHLVRALQSLPSSSLRSLVGAHQQQDAHELFALLNEAIDAEAKAISTDRSTALDADHAGLRTLMAPSLPWAGKAVRTQPLVQHAAAFPHNVALQTQQPHRDSDTVTLLSPFDALLAQRTTCLDCGYCEAIRHFTTSEISLSVPAHNVATPTSHRTGTSACSLTECLAMWSDLEQVDWICWNCSLQSTLAAVRAELATKTPSSSSISSPNGHKQNGTAAANGSAGVSAAKKKRLSQLRSKESKVARILQSGLSEDEVREEAADPTSSLFGVLNGVTLNKTLSRLSTKQIMVSRPPRILALHLNRSSYSAAAWAPSKNNRHVLFNEILDLQPITLHGNITTDGRRSMNQTSTSDTVGAGGTRYRLAAIVVHYGSHSFGHYIAYKRVHGDQWLRISDENVTSVDLAQVRGENPFMLFYEHLPDPTAVGQSAVTRGGSTRVRPRTLHRWHPPTSPSPCPSTPRAQTPAQ